MPASSFRARSRGSAFCSHYRHLANSESSLEAAWLEDFINGGKIQSLDASFIHHMLAMQEGEAINLCEESQVMRNGSWAGIWQSYQSEQPHLQLH